MDEITDTLPTYEEACKLRQDINEHLTYMMKTAMSFLEMEAVEIDNLQKNPARKKKNILSENTGINTHRPTSETTDLFNAEVSVFKKHLETLLSDDFRFSGHPIEYQAFLIIGIRYYKERLQDDKFYFLMDLPEMLAVDRQMNEIFRYCIAVAIKIPPIIKNRKLKQEAWDTKTEETWDKIADTIKFFGKHPEKIKKKFGKKAETLTKNQLAENIAPELNCSARRISDYLDKHLSNETTIKRQGYTISDWIKLLSIK